MKNSDTTREIPYKPKFGVGQSVTFIYREKIMENGKFLEALRRREAAIKAVEGTNYRLYNTFTGEGDLVYCAQKLDKLPENMKKMSDTADLGNAETTPDYVDLTAPPEL